MIRTVCLLAAFAVLASGVCPHSEAALILDSLGSANSVGNGGSEGDSRFSDTTALGIDGSGAGFIVDQGGPNGPQEFNDYAVTGSVSEPLAFGITYTFTIQAMGEVNPTTGAKVTDGGIDRDSQGNLGVRTGANNGINSLEGYLLGIDATGLDPSLALRISAINLTGVGGSESGAVLNLADASTRIPFGSGASFSNGALDVTTLDLLVGGGTSNAAVASVFADNFGGTGGFRIAGFQLDVVAVPEAGAAVSYCMVGAALSIRAFRRRR